nr:MAG TPA: hypothetical protein [Caudoviricetes sp.]
MHKFLETLLLTIISYSILLVFIRIAHLVCFELRDRVEKSIAIVLVLIFIVIFVVIYHL